MKTISITAILACLFMSCATTKGRRCDAYSKSKIDSIPTSFEQAENWIDTIHNRNTFNNNL